MSEEVKITVSGPVGCGKSALLGEIEILMNALGVPVRYEKPDDARSEKGMTHADWQSALEMYAPSVVLIEDMPWLRKEAPAAPLSDAKDAERYRWLTDDHPDAETRNKVRGILGRMSVMSYSAACAAIDAAKEAT